MRSSSDLMELVIYAVVVLVMALFSWLKKKEETAKKRRAVERQPLEPTEASAGPRGTRPRRRRRVVVRDGESPSPLPAPASSYNGPFAAWRRAEGEERARRAEAAEDLAEAAALAEETLQAAAREEEREAGVEAAEAAVRQATRAVSDAEVAAWGKRAPEHKALDPFALGPAFDDEQRFVSEGGSARDREATGARRALLPPPVLARLTPMQQALVYSELLPRPAFGRRVPTRLGGPHR